MPASVTLLLLFVTQLLRLVFSERFNGNLGQRGGGVLVSSYAYDCEKTSQMIPKVERVFEVTQSSESILSSLLSFIPELYFKVNFWLKLQFS